MHNLHIQHHHIHFIHADLIAMQRVERRLAHLLVPVHAVQDQRIIAAAHRHGLQRHMPLSQSDGTALRGVPSCNSRGCARWREGSSHRGRRCDTRCGRWRTAPRSGWRQKRRLSRHGEASAEPVVRQEGESPCRECCEQRLATAGAMESAYWKASNRPRYAASRHCREGGANAPTATPEGSS